MIRSMTGYGTATGQQDGLSIRAEVRSVNSRHLHLSVRGPDSIEAWEPELRERVSRHVQRGRVELWIDASAEGEAAGWELDKARVDSYLRAFERLRHEYSLPGELDLALLAHCSGLLRESASPPLEGLTLEWTGEVTEQALRGLVEMREREGARLADDLQARLNAVAAGLDEVERLAPERLDRERERLRSAVRELTSGDELDEDRIAREVALIADRWDFGEEIVRARSHLEAFGEYLATPAEEPVGKRLGFLLQELHREVNTLGAKANDPKISRFAVEMKNEIEKLREQIENVE